MYYATRSYVLPTWPDVLSMCSLLHQPPDVPDVPDVPLALVGDRAMSATEPVVPTSLLAFPLVEPLVEPLAAPLAEPLAEPLAPLAKPMAETVYL